MPSNRKTGSETVIVDLPARNLLATDSTDRTGLKVLERVNRIHADNNADDRAANHGTNHGRRLCG